MENHPIPQDVTGFKFKLIGSVTVKQFLYLLGFGILATVAFVLDINFFVKIPMMLFFASIGAALAFLPIEGRPMDVMLVNFAKTIPSENRYLYRKRGANLAIYEAFAPPKQSTRAQTVVARERSSSDDQRAALISRLRNSAFRPDESEVRILNNIHTYFENSAGTVPVIPVITPISPQVAIIDEAAQEEEQTAKYEKIEEIAKQAKNTEKKTEDKETIETKQDEPINAEVPVQKDAIRLSNEENTHNIEGASPVAQKMPEKPNPTLSAGFPTLPDVGNVILGIVRDPRGKTLQNILVEVMDSNGIPVRAFKTNALGQFASATPLPDGKYIVHFEDSGKQHEFEEVEINLTGEIFKPLETTSIDAREKLRRELFGGTATA